MLRLKGLNKLAQAAWGLQHSTGPKPQDSLAFIQSLSALALCDQSRITRGFATAPTTTPQDDHIATDIEQSTGIERKEVEGREKGVDIFHEDWLDAPFGTETEPVQVTSYFSERIVGVPDPYDDTIIWWGSVKEGEPPRQIVTGGEYFVLKKLTDENIGHH